MRIDPTSQPWGPTQLRVYADGITDDGPALADCHRANIGNHIDYGNDRVYCVKTPVPMFSKSTYSGKSIIRAAAQIGDAMFTGVGCNKTTVVELEFDCNGSLDFGYYGVSFARGSLNLVEGVDVHDSVQSGIVFNGVTKSKITGSNLVNCGRNVGVNNHGILVYSVAGEGYLMDIGILDNIVDHAYRKGIAVYTGSNGGGVAFVNIYGNTVRDCGLAGSSGGGIYVGNQPGAQPVQGVSVWQNRCVGNYVNIELGNIDHGTAGGNETYNHGGGGDMLIHATVTNFRNY